VAKRGVDEVDVFQVKAWSRAEANQACDQSNRKKEDKYAEDG